MQHVTTSLVATILISGIAATIPAAATPSQQQQTPPTAEASADDGFCGVYGAGYHRVPGTDTCIKVSGHVEVTVGGSGH